MKRQVRRFGVVAAGVALAMALGMSSASAASSRNTGEKCVDEIAPTSVSVDGFGWTVTGTRCATAKVWYTDKKLDSKTQHYVTTYQIVYTVTKGRSHGPRNNENYFRFKAGYLLGSKTWKSPDSGDSNTWISRNPTNGWGKKGSTVMEIQAVPDIPDVSDPKLHIETATW